MLAGRWILFPGTHACRHSLWQPPYARLAKTLDSFASPARSMKPLAMTCALAVACLHSKAQFEPHIAEGNLVACWKAGAIHSRAITSITQVRGNLRRPSQWSSKRCDTEALALGRLGRTWQPKQQAHEGGPRCNESSPWSATATLLMCRGSILRQAASLARRRASRNVRPRSPGKRQENRPRRGRSTNGYGTWRRNEKRARRPFLNDLQTSLELYRSIFGAGNETRTRDPDLGKVVLYQLELFPHRLGDGRHCIASRRRVNSLIQKVYFSFGVVDRCGHAASR